MSAEQGGPTMTRRQFLRVAGAGSAAAFLAACGAGERSATPQTAEATLAPTLPTTDVVPTSQALAPVDLTVLPYNPEAANPGYSDIVAEPAGFEAADEEAAATVTPTEKPAELNDNREVVAGATFRTKGIPQAIDAANVVEVAQGKFVNEIGLGTQAWFAEGKPGTDGGGKLLVGPNFGFKDMTNAEIQQKIDDANGAIEYLNPLNQDAFEEEGPSFFNLQGGGFLLATSAQMRVGIGDAEIALQGSEGHNWMLVVRGRYGDSQRDTDENMRAEFNDYVPRHIQVMAYPGQPNGGFISEGQFNEIAETSHTGGSNCGDAGCTGLSVAMYDVNTQAFTVINQAAPNEPWTQVHTNWQAK